MCQRNFFHRILVLASTDQKDRPIGAFSNNLQHFEPSNKLFTWFTRNFLEFSHLCKVCLYLLETILRQFLVQSLKHRNVSLKVFIVISNIDKWPEDVSRKNNFKSLTIFFDRVYKPQYTETMKLQLMLYFDVLSGIRRVLFSLVEGRTVLHQYTTYDMRSI